MVIIHPQKEKRLNFSIEERVFKDVNWWGGWFRGLVPKWSDWELVETYPDSKTASDIYTILDESKNYKRSRTEYRLIKERKPIEITSFNHLK